MDYELEYIGRQSRDSLKDFTVFLAKIKEHTADRVVRIAGGIIATALPGVLSSYDVISLCIVNGLTLGISEICFLQEKKTKEILDLEDIQCKIMGIVWRGGMLFYYGFCPLLHQKISAGNLIWIYAYFAIDVSNHSGKRIISEWTKKKLDALRGSFSKPQIA